jgi:hypothetical protein
MRAYLLLLLPVLALAQQIPAGTEMAIRLTGSVSTSTAKIGDPVDAVAIAPVAANGHAAIAAGAELHGTVGKVTPASSANTRAALLLRFHRIVIDSRPYPIAARISGVDNARETVDGTGEIDGILASETISGQLDAGLDQLSDRYSGFAGILSAAKSALIDEASGEIVYPAGVEMTLKLTAPLDVPPETVDGPPAWPAAARNALAKFLAHEPFQTMAEDPPKRSDLTNLLLAGPEDAVRRAFQQAGWSSAASLNPFSQFETLRALAEDRGYDEAPVSILRLAGKPPEMVFEKTTDTFAQRHHLRIWRRPGTMAGQPLWAVAATHDIAIDFSEAERTFIHRIDPQIDRERDKVMNDMLFTGRVKACELFDRQQAPRLTQNATGDRIETDGRIAVLWLD